MIAEGLNHLWQSTLFAAAAWLLTIAFRPNGARIRHWIWFAASAKFVVPFAVLVHLESALSLTLAIPSTSARNIAAVLAPIGHPSGVTWVAGLWWPLSLPGNSNGLIVSVFALWACGFVLIALVRLDAWRRIRATVRASTPFQVVGAEMLARVPVRSAPGLLQPGVVGWLRPILLLPAGIEQHLTVPQLHAVLTHELCHVKRRDNFTAGLQMISRSGVLVSSTGVVDRSPLGGRARVGLR